MHRAADELATSASHAVCIMKRTYRLRRAAYPLPHALPASCALQCALLRALTRALVRGEADALVHGDPLCVAHAAPQPDLVDRATAPAASIVGIEHTHLDARGFGGRGCHRRGNLMRVQRALLSCSRGKKMLDRMIGTHILRLPDWLAFTCDCNPVGEQHEVRYTTYALVAAPPGVQRQEGTRCDSGAAPPL